MAALQALAGLQGACAVACGAYGAHGLAARLDGLPDAVKRLAWWSTAAQYQLVHAVLLVVLVLAWRQRPRPALGFALAAVHGGTVIFAGTLYAMALGAPRWLGAVTPIGGGLLLAGWLAFAWPGRPGRTRQSPAKR